ncbi:MAG: inositol monophosphatase [Candidatus Aenigmarchaeota archaeon]|nr:inositol monophosphatase [Candidatus Aenigmarchaeota archaeon]
MKETKAAAQAARKAGKAILSYWGRNKGVTMKGRANFLTKADLASQRIIIRELKHFGHGVLAEENVDRPGELTWVIDPLDGTTNFSRENPHFCVSIALVGREPLAGVIYDPMLNELFVAEQGKGAFLNGTRMRVSKTNALDRALFATEFSPYMDDAERRKSVECVRQIIGNRRVFRNTGSAALDLAYIAAGRFDAYFQFSLKPWDYSAGLVLIPEAGGVAEIAGRLIVASNGTLHGGFKNWLML